MMDLLLKTQQEVHETNTKWNKVIDGIKEIVMSCIHKSRPRG